MDGTGIFPGSSCGPGDEDEGDHVSTPVDDPSPQGGLILDVADEPVTVYVLTLEPLGEGGASPVAATPLT